MPREREGYIEKRIVKVGELEEQRLYVRMQYRDPSGKACTVRRRVKDEATGRKLIKKLKKQYEQNGAHGLIADNLTFRQLASEYKDRRLVPAVYHGEGEGARKVAGLRSWRAPQAFLETLVESFGGRRVRDITHGDVEAFKLKRLQKPTAKGTHRTIASVNRELELMRAVMRYAARQGYILRSPFETGASLISKADEVRRERVLSHNEEARLLAACTGRRAHLRPLIICAIDTAMRRGELFKLCWRDVNLVTREITITALNSKTARARNVAMTPRIHEELERLRAIAPPDDNCLVFGITDTVKKSFAAACRQANVTGFRFHDLRHTAITRMVNTGQPTAVLMKVSGHTQHATFARYVNPDTEAITSVADALARLNAQAEAETQPADEMIN
ncbi:MAG: site-specific integrase [Pyrinomonadaceae bacterium]|nr:site-specific integrase [Pyrinomonadaceae bacterium]